MFPTSQSDVHFRSSSGTTHPHTLPAFEHCGLLFQEHKAREVKTCLSMLVIGVDVRVMGYAVPVTETAMCFFISVFCLCACDMWGPLKRKTRVEALLPKANGSSVPGNWDGGLGAFLSQ